MAEAGWKTARGEAIGALVWPMEEKGRGRLSAAAVATSFRRLGVRAPAVDDKRWLVFCGVKLDVRQCWMAIGTHRTWCVFEHSRNVDFLSIFYVLFYDMRALVFALGK